MRRTSEFGLAWVGLGWFWGKAELDELGESKLGRERTRQANWSASGWRFMRRAALLRRPSCDPADQPASPPARRLASPQSGVRRLVFGVQPLTVWHCRTQHSTDSRSACAGEKEEGGASTVEGEEGRGKSAQTHAHTHARCSALSRPALSSGVGCLVPGWHCPPSASGGVAASAPSTGTRRARAGQGGCRRGQEGDKGSRWSGVEWKNGKRGKIEKVKKEKSEKWQWTSGN